MSDYQGPLSRFTVLDLTRVRSGPTAVRHLADWGANVIKVEAPAAVDKSKGMGGARTGDRNEELWGTTLKELAYVWTDLSNCLTLGRPGIDRVIV